MTHHAKTTRKKQGPGDSKITAFPDVQGGSPEGSPTIHTTLDDEEAVCRHLLWQYRHMGPLAYVDQDVKNAMDQMCDELAAGRCRFDATYRRVVQ